MKKQLLTLSMCLASLGGLYAQSTPYYYKEGTVTDLSQLKNDDLILLQDIHTDRSGFIDLDNTNGFTQFNTDAYYADFNFIDKSYKGGTIFQVKIAEDGSYKFINVENQKYIKNNTNSGATIEATEVDANNTFSITLIDGETRKWKITSKENGFSLDANPGEPVLYNGNGHPFYIHKLTTEKPETPWYYLAVYGIVETDGRKGNCIEKDAPEKPDGIYAGNKIQIDYTNQIWRFEEDPNGENSFAIVNKNGGSIGDRTNDEAKSRYAFNQSEIKYQFQIKKGPDQGGVATFNIQRPEAGKWYINAAGNGQGYYLNEWSAPNANDYMAGAWSAVIATELKSVGEYALGTFSAPYNVELPEGVSAYIAISSNATSLTLEELTLTENILPANTPVVLKSSDAGFYPMKQTATTASPIEKENLLAGTGTDRTLTPSSGAFILSQSNGETGFYNYTGSAIGVFKAYLPKTTADGEQIRVKSIQFPGEGTTGIENIENCVENKNAPIYNLNGQRVTNPTKGIYIKNGKKFIVK